MLSIPNLRRAKQLPYGYQNKIASFMSPEDVILYKLEWDIAAMLKVQGEAIDYACIYLWVDETRES